MLDWIDLFKLPIPSFNVRGRETIGTWPGAVASFCIFFVLILYGALKLSQLMSRANPNISAYVEKNFFDSSEILNLKENNMRFAFGVEGFLDREMKTDSRYVKTLTRITG